MWTESTKMFFKASLIRCFFDKIVLYEWKLREGLKCFFPMRPSPMTFSWFFLRKVKLCISCVSPYRQNCQFLSFWKSTANSDGKFSQVILLPTSAYLLTIIHWPTVAQFSLSTVNTYLLKLICDSIITQKLNQANWQRISE